MQNEILNQRVINELRKGPKAGGQIAVALSHDPKEVRQALADLIEAGKVCSAMDGCRYELASGGYAPGPDGGSAA